MTDINYEGFKEFLENSNHLFPPTNSHPNQSERESMFYWANHIDPTGNHKPSSCGRCYYNARNAIIKYLKIF